MSSNIGGQWLYHYSAILQPNSTGLNDLGLHELAIGIVLERLLRLQEEGRPEHRPGRPGPAYDVEIKKKKRSRRVLQFSDDRSKYIYGKANAGMSRIFKSNAILHFIVTCPAISSCLVLRSNSTL
jgi:hypothetical protein